MNKTFAKNRKSYHDYTMIESFEAGMSLTGAEVKSIRAGHINLLGSYVSIEGNIVTLKQCNISRPENLNTWSINGFDELREKKLLLNKREIKKIHNMVKEKTFTIIVTEVYQRDGTSTIKCKLNVAKGKKNYDKRNDLKNKQADIDTARQMKDY